MTLAGWTTEIQVLTDFFLCFWVAYCDNQQGQRLITIWTKAHTFHIAESYCDMCPGGAVGKVGFPGESHGQEERKGQLRADSRGEFLASYSVQTAPRSLSPSASRRQNSIVWRCPWRDTGRGSLSCYRNDLIPEACVSLEALEPHLFLGLDLLEPSDWRIPSRLEMRISKQSLGDPARAGSQGERHEPQKGWE